MNNKQAILNLPGPEQTAEHGEQDQVLAKS